MKIELQPHAVHLLQEQTYPHHVLSWGVGSGKTYLGCYWMHCRVLDIGRAQSEEYKSAIFAPTFQILRNELFAQYIGMLDRLGWKEGVHYITRRSPDLSVYYPALNHKIMFASADNYKTIVSYSFAFVWLDEPGWLPPEAMQEITKRARTKTKRKGQILRTGVPQGAGFEAYYKEMTGEHYTKHGSYDIEGEGTFTRWRTDGVRLICHASTHQNLHNLRDDYIEILRDSFGYSKSVWLQQVHGLFIPASSGSVFDFSVDTHVVDCKPFRPPPSVIYIGWDFNIGYTNWLTAETRQSSICFTMESPYCRDVPEALVRFKDCYPSQTYANTTFVVLGDRSGYTGTERAVMHGATNYDYITGYLREQGYDVLLKADTVNPMHSTSIITVNRLLNGNPAANVPPALYFDRDMSSTILSMQTTSARKDGRGIEKPADDKITHRSDIVRYMCWFIKPLEYTKAKVWGRYGA